MVHATNNTEYYTYLRIQIFIFAFLILGLCSLCHTVVRQLSNLVNCSTFCSMCPIEQNCYNSLARLHFDWFEAPKNGYQMWMFSYDFRYIFLVGIFFKQDHPNFKIIEKKLLKMWYTFKIFHICSHTLIMLGVAIIPKFNKFEWFPFKYVIFVFLFADFSPNIKLDCDDKTTLDPGCEIVNGRCKCWKNIKRCKSSMHHWSYKNIDVSIVFELFFLGFRNKT